MGKRTDWEEIKPLGEGGQSQVFLVRSPKRVAERAVSVAKVQQHAGGCRIDGAAELAEAAWNYARPEIPSELGALKIFKIPPEGQTLPAPPGSNEFEAIVRLKNEIAELGQDLPGLPKLLSSRPFDGRYLRAPSLLTRRGKSDNLIIRFMKKTSITVTEASRNFADCVNRAHYQNVTFVLLKNGEPFARLVPDNAKVCVGRDLAAALAKTDLPEKQAKAWRRDLQAARKTLKAPADKWR
jgi:antitoxin (DNA-binding transcriptional repressor) of toxin-antitoxin stability system